MTEHVIILSTAPTRAEAESIARALVEEGLAACVQMRAIESVYRWEGGVEQAAEVALQVKTRAPLAATASARIVALHSYDVPEIVVLPVVGGSPAYLGWIDEAVGGRKR
ncbi:MAG: divalent-cation tolerance protein CutA [Sphingomonas sanxanigenens]|uniref:Divalent-cation tolerance protein CutA n=1 Tax=Sphingomonas sanxanigenens TaxID=397260 RepID=A0A2W5AEJ0_9SPHN|nr:MAG: divalent-cation tolerance protein CutA [Sphingomonas sanxanigenens]